MYDNDYTLANSSNVDVKFVNPSYVLFSFNKIEPKNTYNKISLHLYYSDGKGYYQAYAFYDKGRMDVLFDNKIGQLYVQFVFLYPVVGLIFLAIFVALAYYSFMRVRSVRKQIQKLLKYYIEDFIKNKSTDQALNTKLKVVTLYDLNDLRSRIRNSRLSFLYRDLSQTADHYFEIVLFDDLKKTDGKSLTESLLDSIQTEISSRVGKEPQGKKVKFYEIESEAKKLIFKEMKA
jgi:hypothetical protein